MKPPEFETAPELFYDEEKSLKYAQSSRMRFAQGAMARRCVELGGKDGGLALDIGCGTGFSARVLGEGGFEWVGIDISDAMLRLCGGNVVHADAGAGLPFQPGAFDFVMSVSCVQWLFHAYRSGQDPLRRVKVFFRDLFAVLRPDGVCVLQFFCTAEQTAILRREAVAAGFDGSLVVDGPETRNEKTFLVLRNETRRGRRSGGRRGRGK